MRRPSIGTFPRAGPNKSPSALSRRHFVGVTAAAAGITLGSTLWTPARSDSGGQPCPGGAADPIPHLNARSGTHVFFPGHADGSASSTDHESAVQANGRDPSTIFDFDGVIGQADLNLSGMGTDTTTGVSAPYTFHTDMRFMAGNFLDTDGKVRKG